MIISSSTVTMAGASQSNSAVRETEKTTLQGAGWSMGRYNYSATKQSNSIADYLVDSYVKGDPTQKDDKFSQNPNSKEPPGQNQNAKNPNAATPNPGTGPADPNPQNNKGVANIEDMAKQIVENSKKALGMSSQIFATKESLKDMLVILMLKNLGFKFSAFDFAKGPSGSGGNHGNQPSMRRLSMGAFAGVQREQKSSGSKAYTVVPKGSNEELVHFKTERTSETAMSQSYSFNATAQVKTADGKVINLDISLNMSSELYKKTSETITGSYIGEPLVKNLCDPLVINYAASSASLTQTKFEFDLDMDGTADQISTLAKGSGFLALDKNGDGIINDGSELFGAASGDGFADLKAYDSDNNGWIDEADDIYSKLRIWSVNEDGSSSLVGLGEAGIGAVYLGSVAGEYLLGEMDDPDGVIRRTGFFLRENGTAGTVQHIDLAI